MFLSHVPRTQVMACLLHGDAAFSGQGVVAETLQLSGMLVVGVAVGMHVWFLSFVLLTQMYFTTVSRASAQERE